MKIAIDGDLTFSGDKFCGDEFFVDANWPYIPLCRPFTTIAIQISLCRIHKSDRLDTDSQLPDSNHEETQASSLRHQISGTRH